MSSINYIRPCRTTGGVLVYNGLEARVKRKHSMAQPQWIFLSRVVHTRTLDVLEFQFVLLNCICLHTFVRVTYCL